MKNRHRQLIVSLVVFAVPAFSQTFDFHQQSSSPSEQEISDFYFVKDVLGFPYDDRYTKKNIIAVIPSPYQLTPSEKVALKWHKDGLLTDENRRETLNQVIRSNDSALKSMPCEGFLSYSQFGEEHQKKGFDPSSLAAAFYLSAQSGEIGDILPFLRFSQVYTNPQGAGIPSPIASAHDNKETILPPKERLTYFPAAYALFSHSTEVIPLLLKTIQDATAPEDLRLRAAAFLNTMNPNLLNDRLYENCEKEMSPKLRLIKEEVVLWCDALDAITDHDKEQDRRHWDRYKKRWDFPDDVDMIEQRKKDRREAWKFLQVDYNGS
ncbi:MAG: hypothetical protein JXR73_16815 [Candidatus Omnitrophica bacterium]|nr:hypothetical protein [Candidatus Omnitrophota bacterium]